MDAKLANTTNGLPVYCVYFRPMRLHFIATFAVLFLMLMDALAQLAIRNGVSIPTRDTLNVLIVFAEVDFGDGPCHNNAVEDFKGNWPKAAKGRTLPPTFADSFFDTELKPGAEPKGFITQFYHEASFGQYVLLGDYLPRVVTIPCKNIREGDNGVSQILKVLGQRDTAKVTLHTNSGFPLKHFDKWTDTGRGKEKLKEADGKIDLLYIIWRNNRILAGPNTRDNAGYGVMAVKGGPFKDMDGLNNMASFNVSSTEHGAKFITIAEHLHGIFGGNHWHSAGGRGMHTFLVPPSSYGITGQFGAAMQAASGWDRWMMEWKRSDKNFVISALNLEGQEVVTDLVSIETHPHGASFILRDLMQFGDAVRIKLPHIDWQKVGDVKNQYLWLENRQMKFSSDRWYDSPCADSNEDEFPYGTPGIYSYIQVGKDQKEGGAEIYSSATAQPNGLASPFFPVTAEGNFDFEYRYDRLQKPDYGMDCNWGNENIPKDVKRSRPNPFTGHSDLFAQFDYNRDGKLYSGDKIECGMSELVGDSVIHNYHISGDWEDAFSAASGKMELSLSTNPAAVTVYTFGSNFEFGQYLFKDGRFPSFENRSIWLNGLEIRFSELGKGRIRVDIRWDQYHVKKNVRWCGSIELSPNDFNTNEPSLVVENGATVSLEHGESPTFREAIDTLANGTYVFSAPTQLNVRANAIMVLESGSKLVLNDDSKLIVMNGGKLIVKKGAKVTVGKHAKLSSELPDGIVKESGSSIKFKK